MIPAIFHNLPKSAQQLALGTGAVVASLAGLHVSADLGLAPRSWKPSPQVWAIASIAGVAGVGAIACLTQQEPQQQQEGVNLPQLQAPAYIGRSLSTGANPGTYEQLTAATVSHTLAFPPGSPQFAEAMKDGLGLLNHAKQVFQPGQQQEEWRSTAVSSAGAYGQQNLLTGENDDLQNGYGTAEDYPALQASTDPTAVDHTGGEDISGDAWSEYEPEVAPLPELEPKSEIEPEPEGPKVMRLSVLKKAAASGNDSSYVA